MLPILNESISEFDNVTVINADIMKTDIAALIKKEFGAERVKVCANLPYYITSPVITALLDPSLPIDGITVMIQKEVAERIAAKPGTKSYGALTAAVTYYANPQILKDVPPSAFMPQPKVWSSAIRLKMREKPAAEVKSEEMFFKVVRASFALRRKTLLNALTKDEAAHILESAGIDPQRRGETLSLDEFAKIADSIGGVHK